MLVATETKVFGVICFNRVVKVLFGCSADDFFHFAKLHPFCELNGHDTGDQSSDGNIIGETSNLLYEEDGSFSPKIDFDDGDLDDDGIEPAIREKIDREVADFARRINSDWTERMQDFLTSGRERTSTFSATNGNGYLRRHA